MSSQEERALIAKKTRKAQVYRPDAKIRQIQYAQHIIEASLHLTEKELRATTKKTQEPMINRLAASSILGAAQSDNLALKKSNIMLMASLWKMGNPKY